LSKYRLNIALLQGKRFEGDGRNVSQMVMGEEWVPSITG